MSNHEYDDNCEHCQPTLIDLNTNQPLPTDHPYIKAICRVFKEQCTLTERRAWHRVVMQQSQNEIDINIATKVATLMTEELRKIES